MVSIYLSGTGNTKYCIELLTSLIDQSARAIPLECCEDVIDAIQCNDTIVLGYPTQFSNAPYMVREFISKNSALWQGKNILCVATMGAFSGDGAGCTARLLKKYGANILGGLHIKMPDSVCDSKLLKKSSDENRRIIAAANRKIEETALHIRNGKYPKNGITVFSYIIGLFGQRLWFSGKTADYSTEIKVSTSCNGCGLCASICPMKNISVKGGKAVPHSKCTMCYRCISSSPQKAITLLGNEVIEQYRIEKYL